MEESMNSQNASTVAENGNTGFKAEWLNDYTQVSATTPKVYPSVIRSVKELPATDDMPERMIVNVKAFLDSDLRALAQEHDLRSEEPIAWEDTNGVFMSATLFKDRNGNYPFDAFKGQRVEFNTSFVTSKRSGERKMRITDIFPVLAKHEPFNLDSFLDSLESPAEEPNVLDQLDAPEQIAE